MRIESLREQALELISDVRVKIGAVQCVHFKGGIGADYASLVQYDDMLEKIESKILLDSIHIRKKTDKECDDELLELVMFINLMDVINRGFDKGEIMKHELKSVWVR